jgi:hypothetical protein
MSFLIAASALRTPLDDRVIMNGILVLLCVEFLAKQATYIWNDVLDACRDGSHPWKKKRFLALLANSRISSPGKLLFGVRAGAAFCLSLILAVTLHMCWVTLLVLIVFGMQTGYHRCKRHSAGYRLFFGAVGYSERAVAGTLAVMSSTGRIDVQLLVLIGVLIVDFAVIFLAATWWAEDEFLRRENALQDEQGKHTSKSWFLDHGEKVRYAANAILLPAALFVAARYFGNYDRYWVILLFASAAANVGAILMVWVMRRRADATGMVGTGTRWLCLSTLGVMVALAWLCSPRGLRGAWIVVAMPIVLTVGFERLRYEELVLMPIILTIQRVIRIVNREMFGS